MDEGKLHQMIFEPDSVVGWWDRCHGPEAKEEEKWFLTGSQGEDVWNNLKITHRLTPGSTVLNIGVGLGYCTKKLAAQGCRVSALDISEYALKKVESVCEGCYTHEKLDTLPSSYFDTAISNLVAQHMNNEDLFVQLFHVLRSLKSGGIFAIQFAYSLSRRFEISDESEVSQKGGGVCRSLGMIEQLIYRAGGDILLALNANVWPEAGSGWFVVHATKR